MKVINLIKYGFIRDESQDFSDDGNRFTGYTVGKRVRVSKLVSHDDVYISARIEGRILDYTEYSKLPHYLVMDKLNGVSKSSLTEQDLIDLYNNCLEYEKEYEELESQVVFPTLEEIKNQCIKIRQTRKEEFDIINRKIKTYGVELFLKSSEYEIREFKRYYSTLQERMSDFDPETYPQIIQNTNCGRNFIKPTNQDLKPCWYYRQLEELIEKVVSR